jgi:hypothetical protein
LVEQKLITQAQADAIKTNVDAAVAALTTSNSTHGMIKGGIDGLDMLQGVTLTDTQKTALLGWAKNSATVQKKIVALYKDAGAITQAQADTMNTQIDARAADPLTFTKMGGGMMNDGKMGGGHRGHGGNSDNDSTQSNSTVTTG